MVHYFVEGGIWFMGTLSLLFLVILSLSVIAGTLAFKSASSVLAKGIKITCWPTIYGIVIYLVSILISLGLEYRVNYVKWPKCSPACSREGLHQNLNLWYCTRFDQYFKTCNYALFMCKTCTLIISMCIFLCFMYIVC